MNEHLKLYHTTDETHKGIIFDHSDHLVLPNLPVPIEHVLPNLPDLPDLPDGIPDAFPLEVYPTTEGTLIRVFYYHEEWHLATSSRLDAYTSFWSARKSFGKQFEEYVEAISGTPFDVFLCSLDPSKGYFFLLPTDGVNRLGKSQDDPHRRIYLVAEYLLSTQELKWGSQLEPEHNVWSYIEPCTLHSVEEWNELVSKDEPLVMYKPCEPCEPGTGYPVQVHKFVSQAYVDRCQRRNNNQNLLGQYFTLLREDPEQAEHFRAMYPEANIEFYAKQLGHVVHYIHKNYYNRYVKREHTIVPKVYFQIMKQCHENYLETRVKTTPNKVYETILSQDTKLILSLIRNFSY